MCQRQGGLYHPKGISLWQGGENRRNERRKNTKQTNKKPGKVTDKQCSRIITSWFSPSVHRKLHGIGQLCLPTGHNLLGWLSPSPPSQKRGRDVCIGIPFSSLSSHRQFAMKSYHFFCLSTVSATCYGELQIQKSQKSLSLLPANMRIDIIFLLSTACLLHPSRKYIYPIV